MEFYDVCLLILIISTLILLFVRNKIKTKYIEIRRAPNVGGCMTIGTREVQEDCYYVKSTDKGSFMAVADGMGEAYGGRIAARTAIGVCEDMFSTFNILDNPRYFFRKIFHSANKEILKAMDNGSRGYSSLCTALIYGDKLFYSLVGNIKIFVYRNGDLVEVSTGHTLDAISKSKFHKGKITRTEALSLLNNYRLYNYLGQDEFKDLEIFDTPVSLKLNDIVIIMTDGVYETLSFEELEKVLSKKLNSEEKSLEIIQMINNNDKEEQDNASIVMWQIVEEIK